MDKILYEKGNHYVVAERFGNSKSTGFAVYKNGITCATRCASIGYSGEEGFQRAKKECDRREITPSPQQQGE